MNTMTSFKDLSRLQQITHLKELFIPTLLPLKKKKITLFSFLYFIARFILIMFTIPLIVYFSTIKSIVRNILLKLTVFLSYIVSAQLTPLFVDAAVYTLCKQITAELRAFEIAAI